MRPGRYAELVDQATGQFGLVTAGQLLALGWAPGQTHTMIGHGLLRREGRGLYSLPGTADSVEHRAMRAVLRCGVGAVASHSTAALLHRLDGIDESAESLHVSVNRSRQPRITGVVVHRSRDLTPRHVTRVAGVIPCTTVVRTLIDLGAVADPGVVERATESALRRRLVSLDYLQRHLDLVGRQGREGAGTLRGLLVARGDVPPTGSDLETVALQLFRDEAGLELERQVEFVPGVFVDLGERRLRIGIELDGFEYHSSRAQLLDDVSRQNRLVLAGVLLIRFGWEHVYLRRHRAGVLETARAAVAARTAAA